MSRLLRFLAIVNTANPAKGNLRGQTTLAADIERWQAMANNLLPQIDQFPGLKEQLAQFEALLAEAKDARDQLNTQKANLATVLERRNELFLACADLFSRISLGLKSAHGPKSQRLREFGLKPRKKRTGRASLSTPPPPVEVVATGPKPPAASAAPASPAPARE